MKSELAGALKRISSQGRYRCLQEIEAVRGPIIQIDGRELVNFSSNDYLGLATHPKLIEAAQAATAEWGAGSGASRLISGNLEIHEALERDIANWKRTESSLLFNSGYHANIGAIPALAGEGDVILSDALNHASLIDGCRLSRAETRVFAHNDMDALESLLKAAQPQGRRFIVTEAVFSMDGDRAPLNDMLALADRYDAWVYLDEAHAVGVLGKTGAGLVEEFGIAAKFCNRLIQMGTLGKALGSFGAYVAGPSELREFLVNTARSFIFTTALPAGVAAAARRAIEILRADPEPQHRLWENIRYFYQLARASFPIGEPQSAIIPIVIGGESEAVRASLRLREAGYFIQAIRPPTVPAGTSRLRLTLSAGHQKNDIEGVARTLKRYLQ